MPNTLINVYYKTVTEESSQIGEYEEQGLEDEIQVAPNEWDIADAQEHGLDPEVYTVLSHVQKYGSLELANGYRQWFETTDPVHDREYFEKGTQKYYSIFIDGLNADQWKQLLHELNMRTN
jgi:hypothetical protein